MTLDLESCNFVEGTCIGFEARYFVEPYRFWQVYRNGSPLLLEIYWFRIKSITDPARSKNLTLLHQNNQIQNIKTTTCGYFCLYFLNEISKGTTYFDLLRVFDIHYTTKNEQFIEKYLK